MLFRKRKRRPSIGSLDHVALAEILRGFEDSYFQVVGERITSAEFYDRYKAGEVDDFGDAIRWASYYELLRAQGQQALSDDARRAHSVVAV